MANLLSTYEQMVKTAQATAPAPVEADPRTEILEKYASLSDNMLAQEFGNDYNQDDVVKLAQMMIDHDVEVEQNMEKVAELHEMGVIIAKGFKAEMNTQG